MEFLKIAYTILEIYPKGEKSSNDPKNEDINENSHWIQVSTNLIESNPNILQGDLNEFAEKILKLFDDFYLAIKTNVENKFPESHQEVMREFDEGVANSDSYTFDISKIDEFYKKYIDTMEQHKTLISNMVNIVSIKNYIKVYIPETTNMTIVTFEF